LDQIKDVFGQRSFPDLPFVNINADNLNIQVVLSSAEQKSGMVPPARSKDDMERVYLRASCPGQHGLEKPAALALEPP
jgi:hypothetical protein